MNENLARGLGIQAERIRLATFGLGAGLGALAGALITPLSSVDPAWACPGWSAPSCWWCPAIRSARCCCLVYGACQVLVSVYLSPILGGVTIAAGGAGAAHPSAGLSHD